MSDDSRQNRWFQQQSYHAALRKVYSCRVAHNEELERACENHLWGGANYSYACFDGQRIVRLVEKNKFLKRKANMTKVMWKWNVSTRISMWSALACYSLGSVQPELHCSCYYSCEMYLKNWTAKVLISPKKYKEKLKSLVIPPIRVAYT